MNMNNTILAVKSAPRLAGLNIPNMANAKRERERGGGREGERGEREGGRERERGERGRERERRERERGIDREREGERG